MCCGLCQVGVGMYGSLNWEFRLPYPEPRSFHLALQPVNLDV